jgi:hypothetical protein
MRRRVLVPVIVAAALGAVMGVPAAAAHTLVDPTTLTPPLKPFRVCFDDGQWVKCDTSGPTVFFENEPALDLSCGTAYLTGTEETKATRWYDEDLLLVERNAVDTLRGTLSLSPDGSGPTAEIAADFSWHEAFPVPGDLSSDVEVSHGNFVRIQGLGAVGMDAGTFREDGSFRGHAGEASPEADAAICDLLMA